LKQSEKISQIIEEALGKKPIDNSLELSEEERLVKFMEHVGMDEGIDFCIDDGEVYIPEDMELEDDIKLFESKKFKKYPDVEFKMLGEEVKVVSSNPVFDSIKVPLCVYQVIESHIK
jgi:hypothetical protein